MTTTIIQCRPSNWNDLMLYQKIQYYQKYLNQYHSKFVDKLNARKIVSKQIEKDEILIPKIIIELENWNSVQEEHLNSNYIIKSSHGSKWNINILPEKIYKLNVVKMQLKEWNRLYNPKCEKQYCYLKPRFFIEEKIDDYYFGKTGNAVVFMCRVFYGKCHCISPLYNGKQNDYDTNWNIIGDNNLDFIQKPKKLDLMIKYAEKLGDPFEFVRIDFYIDKNDDLYFSEYTFSPAAGNIAFSLKLEKELSKYWI